jgi:DNA-binding response OmpR family regulator
VKNESRKKTSLLIVDDDKAVRRLLARVAERAGFEVETAKDGVQALEMLQQKHYEIAIVDLMMPRMSGYDLVQKISTLDPRPVVIVATALMNGDVSSLDDSMVRRVIKKPFDINAVANSLMEIAREAAEKRPAVAPAPENPTIVVAKDKANEVTIVAAGEVVTPTAEEPSEKKPDAELPPTDKIE